MTPDYDLSGLANSQVDLWLYLHFDAIRAQIFFGQATGAEPGHFQRRSVLTDGTQTTRPRGRAPGEFAREN